MLVPGNAHWGDNPSKVGEPCSCGHAETRHLGVRLSRPHAPGLPSFCTSDQLLALPWPGALQPPQHLCLRGDEGRAPTGRGAGLAGGAPGCADRWDLPLGRRGAQGSSLRVQLPAIPRSPRTVAGSGGDQAPQPLPLGRSSPHSAVSRALAPKLVASA